MRCKGQLKGDPDIAGVGITASIVITAAISIIVAASLWYIRLIRQNHKSALYRTLLKCAFVLADIQLVTALAIIAATLKIIYADNDTSLYHIFVGMILAQINLSGCGVALIFDSRKQTNWALRFGLYNFVLGMYFWLIVKCIEEFQNFGRETPRCFYNNSLSPGTYLFWMYVEIPWAIIQDFWIYVEAFPGPASSLLEDLDGFALDVGRGIREDLRVVPNAVRHLDVFGCTNLLADVFWRLALLVLLSVTVCPPTTTPFGGFFFIVWNVYEVYWVRSANRHILVVLPENHSGTSLQGNQNPEDDWGFGQLLPLLLLILPVLQFADTWLEENRRFSANNTKRAAISGQTSEVLRRQKIGLVRK